MRKRLIIPCLVALLYPSFTSAGEAESREARGQVEAYIKSQIRAREAREQATQGVGGSWGSSASVEEPPDTVSIKALRKRFSYDGVLVAEFEGRRAAQDLVAALLALTKEPSAIPVGSHTVERGESPCLIYRRRAGIPCVPGLLKLASALNGNRNFEKLPLIAGQTFHFPAVHVVATPASQIIPAHAIEQTKKDESLPAAKRTRLPNGSLLLQYDGYELQAAIDDLDRVLSARQRLYELDIAEMAFSFEHGYLDADEEGARRALQLEAPRYSSIYLHPGDLRAPGEHLSECQNKETKEFRQGAYAYLVNPNSDGVCSTLGLTDSEKEDLKDKATTAEVILVDNPVWVHADFDAEKIEGGKPGAAVLDGRCRMASEWKEEEYHSTHLAGLIVSQDNEHGFVGLNPDAKLISFDPSPMPSVGAVSDSSPQNAEARLADEIKRVMEQPHPTPPVFLFPTLLVANRPPTLAYEPWRLKNAEHRTRNPAAKRIWRHFPLWIVSAGTPKKQGEPRLDIRPDTALSPQNLGDLQNVIVVTACLECGGARARLDPTAHYSMENPSLVHVAAPGMDIPGPIGHQEYYRIGGTSQAAAFAAGVASAMIGCYPGSFQQPYQVKRRLMLTSRPTFPPDELEYLGAGVVDPYMATIDPEKHWLETKDRLEPSRIDGWCQRTLSLAAPNVNFQTQLRLDVKTKNILRIVRYQAVEFIEAHWLVYARNEQERGRGDEEGDLVRYGPGRLETDDPLLKVGGDLLRLSEISDLILADPVETSLEAGDCSDG